MKIGNLDLNVKKGSTQIQKVMHGVKTVWTNWVYKTGSLYKMTADKTGTFTASKNGWGSDSPSAWRVFDGDFSNTYSVFTNNPNETAGNQPTNPHVKIMFGREIRLVEIKSKIGHGAEAVTNSNWFHIYGIKADGIEVDLGTTTAQPWNDPTTTTHNVSEENQKIPFVGLVVHRKASGAGYYYIYEIQVTKWYQKGD